MMKNHDVSTLQGNFQVRVEINKIVRVEINKNS